MVYKCCIPLCRSNYDSSAKKSVFSFPKSAELKARWISSIPRDFAVTSHSKVCELHFNECDIRRTSEASNPNTGEKITVQLLQPRLMKDAIPKIFPNCPTYLSREEERRESPIDKRNRIENEQLEKALADSLKSKEDYEKKYCFDSTTELLQLIEGNPLPDNWSVIPKGEDLLFVYIDSDLSFPEILYSVKIYDNLSFNVYNKNGLFKCDTLNLPSNIHSLTKLYDIFQMLPLNINVIDVKLRYIIKLLSELADSSSEDHKKLLLFIINQLELMHQAKNHRKYDNDVLIFSCLIFSISPHCYRFIRSTGFITLPHPSTLRNICRKYNASPNDEEGDNFLGYMKQKFPLLIDSDKVVVLMLDEIHLKPFLDYKGGSILGFAHNSEDVATSAQVFMVQSIRSVYKDVAFIQPVKGLKADVLHSTIKNVVVGLENIGLTVFCVITDNNSINRRSMSFFSAPHQLQIVYNHPCDSKRPLFYVIDSVHIIKCVRNNWLNQRDKCMYFPPFPSQGITSHRLQTASFTALKTLHSLESNNLLSFAYGLTVKALSPTSLERQNVKLALQVFNHHVAEGLRIAGERNGILDSSSTAAYIDIMTHWFNIMNVKTPYKGSHKRDIFQEPLTSNEDDPKLQFLEKFLVWLDVWEASNADCGKLTRETHLAITHTTYALREIVQYCAENFGLNYILTGKFQTDALEDRFGKYRQLAGSNYHISVNEVFETETKLRIQSLSAAVLDAGENPIEDNISLTASFNTDKVFEEFVSKLQPDEEIKKIEPLKPILAYIGGYCCFTALKKLKNCTFCRSNITTEDLFEIEEMVLENNEVQFDKTYDLIKNLDRGHLKYPTGDIIKIVAYVYVLSEKLTTGTIRSRFLQENNQRLLLVTLVMKLLQSKNISIINCPQNHSGHDILKYIVTSCSNIMLKNFCKLKNDDIERKKKEKAEKSKENKMRKLQTLTN